MTASFEGHVDIVKTLIEAKTQVNTQEVVWLLLQKTHCTANDHTQHWSRRGGACAWDSNHYITVEFEGVVRHCVELCYSHVTLCY